MGKVLVNAGGGGGIDPDGLTATPGDVLAGKKFGGAGSDDAQTGILALTGNADDAKVLSGYTYYNTDAKTRRTGNLAINSILSFSAAAYSTSQILFTWQNPYAAAGKPFSRVVIRYSTTGYGQNNVDLYTGTGNNTASGGISSIIFPVPEVGKGYYFQCFSVVDTSVGAWVDTKGLNAYAATTAHGQVVLTSSGTWTVPAGVRVIDVFCVGGGGGGRSSSDTSASSSGGGSGYTRTWGGVSVYPGQSFPHMIGIGGPGGYGGGNDHQGGTTSFGSYSVAGGFRNPYISVTTSGKGGSGGGRGISGNVARGNDGYSDGHGEIGGDSQQTGQGSTTRAFGEVNNVQYAGGGGAGGKSRSGGVGGDGGGGNGGGSGDGIVLPTPGTPNTGGGGGGGMRYISGLSDPHGRSGGSGVIIVRW